LRYANWPDPVGKRAQLEQTNILWTLETAKWKVFGEKGAAILLEGNASTLVWRMKALKIEMMAVPVCTL
jgi:hypothetical protein